jgi:hypothetical protein
MEAHDNGRRKISLGVFGVFGILSLVLLIRGSPNDSYMAILVFMIALFQLLEYGVWINQDCFPGGANDKATRGAYILLWLMPAILAFSGFLFGSYIAAEDYAYGMLLMCGLMFTFLAGCFISIMLYDKTTWCTTPGEAGQPIWWFLRNASPMDINVLWLVGMFIPLVFVDPLIIGSGTFIVVATSAFLGRQADMAREGEWISSTALLSNCVVFWALAAPYIRDYLFFPVQIHSV